MYFHVVYGGGRRRYGGAGRNSPSQEYGGEERNSPTELIISVPISYIGPTMSYTR